MKTIHDHLVFENLKSLYKKAPKIDLNDQDSYVIFSDFHLGNRTGRDDFLSNSSAMMNILRKYYLEKGYKLILNGDIEELQKFKFKKIRDRWDDLYELFAEFDNKTGLYKIVGNHDADLKRHNYGDINSELYDALRLEYNGHTLFLFHGHQAGYSRRKHRTASVVLKYFARPFGIKNITRDYDNKRRLKMEQCVYNFSAIEKVVSVIGHTHRPLFESLSEIDYVKFKIESLIRDYIDADNSRKEDIQNEINILKQDLARLYEEETKYSFRGSLYNEKLVIPAIFNSGCVIGKRGITGLEIFDGKITLVHWFDKNSKKKYFRYSENLPESLTGSDYMRMVLKDDTLDYIFSRMTLLS